MTLRSLLLGLVFAAFICGVTFFNDMVVRGTYVVGNYMPISVFGGLLLVLGLNVLLRRLGAKIAFSGRELSVVVAMTLTACAVPGCGLMHHFTNVIMLPYQRAQTDLSWKRQEVLSLVPAPMLADLGLAGTKAVEEFSNGTRLAAGQTTQGTIPWQIWKRPLMFWLPLILSIWLATIALAVVMHRQWSRHEKLRYPIAVFAHTLLPDQDHRTSIFRNGLFWIAAGILIVVHVNNYASLYLPGTLSRIPLAVNLTPLVDALLPILKEGGGRRLFYVEVFPTAVGFAYLLSLDLSLSLGVAPFCWAIVNGIFLSRGIVLDKGFFEVHPRAFLHAGAFTGLFLILLYAGRRYYARVFRAAVWLGGPAADPPAVWAARLFMAGMAVFVLQLVLVGLWWPLALLYALGAVVIYTVLARIVAETGAFYIHPWFFPGVVLLGFLGLEAIPLRSLTIMFMVTTVILINPREAVMPFMVNALKLAELTGAPVARTARAGAAALVLGLAVAVPATLFFQYTLGAKNTGDGWSLWAVPGMGLSRIAACKSELEHLVWKGNPVDAVADLSQMHPDWPAVSAFGIALTLVLGVSACRLRYAWWPIHPILFAVLGTYQSFSLSRSFLLGWAIKAVICRLSGGAGYEKAKPVMIGLIAGDMLGGIIAMLFGACYYLATDTRPPWFSTLP